MKKIVRKIHLWLSVPFGVIITLICFSGAMLVFEKEFVRMMHAEYFEVIPSGRPLPVGQVARLVAATLPDDVQVTGVTVPSDSSLAYQVLLSKPRHASVYVDPYTGEVKGQYQRPPFFATMFSLHRWLLGDRPADGGVFWGKMIVGVSTLMFVIALVSGMLIWWPRTQKAFRNSLRITIRKGWQRFWYGLHVAGGMYALLLLLVMALTGLTWSFDWYRTGFYRLFGLELEQPNRQEQSAPLSGKHGRGNALQGRSHEGGAQQETAFGCWQQVYDELARRNPSYRQITVSRGSATVSFSSWGNQRASDRYTFHPRTGEITDVTYYKNSNASGKLRGWIYSIHVGNWGGWLTQVLWFLSALMGATLPLTGYYLWIRRLCRKNR